LSKKSGLISCPGQGTATRIHYPFTSGYMQGQPIIIYTNGFGHSYDRLRSFLTGQFLRSMTSR